MKIVFDFNRTLFDPNTQALYADAKAVLIRLAAQHELFLISINKPERKLLLEKLGIQRFFSKITFVEQKTFTTFTDMLNNAVDVIVVGDRIAEEIRLGKLLGYTTIHVQQEEKLVYQQPLRMSDQPDYAVTHLEEILAIVEKITK